MEGWQRARSRAEGTSSTSMAGAGRLPAAKAVNEHPGDAFATRTSVRSGRVSLAVRQHGSSGEVVVALHGGPGCPDYLEPVARHLGAHFRAVTFDQRGVGASAGDGSFGLDDYVGDVEAVREHLGADKIRLLGHSWGGLLAQLYLRAHPDRVTSVVLVSPSSGVGEHWVRMQREVMAYNRRRGGPARFAAMGAWSLAASLPGDVGDAAGRRVLAEVWRNYFPDPGSAPGADRTWLAGVRSIAARRTVKAITAAPASMLDGLGASTDAPVLVVYGEDDIYGESAGHLTSRFPEAQRVLLGNCGHLPWLQAPERFFRLLDQFESAPTGPRR